MLGGWHGRDEGRASERARGAQKKSTSGGEARERRRREGGRGWFFGANGQPARRGDGDGETRRDGDGEAGGLLGVATDQDRPRDEERGNEAEGRLDAGEACAALESHRQVGCAC